MHPGLGGEKTNPIEGKMPSALAGETPATQNKANLPGLARKLEALNPKSETTVVEETKPIYPKRGRRSCSDKTNGKSSSAT